MATFPAYPKLLFDGFDEKPEPAILRTEMESGPPKQALIRSRTMITRSVQYLLESNADYQSFLTWFKTTINYGADWFDWTDPVDDVLKSARIVGGDITPKPTRKNLSRWVVSFKLETWSA